MNVSRRRYMGEKGGSIPYQRIEYLESTGTQYIDLGSKATQDTTIEVEFYCVDSVNIRVFGARTNFSTDAFAVVFVGGGNTMLSFNYDNISNSDALIFNIYGYDGYWHTAKSNGNGHRQIDNLTKTGGYTNFMTPYNVLLFGYNNNGTVSYGKIRVRKCKFNSLDLIPVRIGTTGYLYDQVSGELFGNAGTGDFVLGSDVTDE